MSQYKLKLDVFEGPLDLLLYLIKKNDMDIQDIPIAKVTEQYMAYIETLKLLDLEVVGDFLVMAATLMHIKSKMLLPPDPAEVTPQEDPRDELVQRLNEYKRFKEIADELQLREISRRDLFARPMDAELLEKWKEEAKETYFEASLFDLISALQEAMQRVPEDVMHEIMKENFTVEHKIHEILHSLLSVPRLIVQDLFKKARSKVEIVVTFLAILELIRLKEIKVVQNQVFGDIEVLRNRENIMPVENETPSKE